MPTQSGVPYWLLRIFIAHSVVVMLLLRWRRESTPAFRLVVHTIDIFWPAVISLYATGQPNPFFLFFVFVMLAAAYRWGLWETIGTALAAVALIWAEWLLLYEGFRPPGVVVSDFEPKRFFMRSISLGVTGLFLGYLAEQQKELRAEKTVITRILGKARVDLGLSGTLQAMLSELMSTFEAKAAILTSQEANSLRVFVAKVESGSDPDARLIWLEPSSEDRNLYLGEWPGEAFVAERVRRGSENYEVLSIDERTQVQKTPASELARRLAARHPFEAAVSVSFTFGREWWGRVFLLDPRLTADRVEGLRFLQELVKQVGPAVYNVFLLRRLRLRAGAVERARVARELHDGAVQSLIAMEMQVDVLRRTSGSLPARISDELRRIQGLLREEVLKLRELMQEMKSIEVDAQKLPAFLNDTVERFQRETGIRTSFNTDDALTGMEQRVCREITRIVQEGLVNVRKHSQAQHVTVELKAKPGAWLLVIEDDGRGFGFSGRLSQAELDEARKGPVVLKERVRLINAQLTIESHPGRGSRLEITVPQQREAAHG
ncbi:MAG TPA: histidine kinase [Terriglobales bacterium]|nr:histidine kinase [Terriglobales bacterium]